jgi:hypothetical protein
MTAEELDRIQKALERAGEEEDGNFYLHLPVADIMEIIRRAVDGMPA